MRQLSVPCQLSDVQVFFPRSRGHPLKQSFCLCSQRSQANSCSDTLEIFHSIPGTQAGLLTGAGVILWLVFVLLEVHARVWSILSVQWCVSQPATGSETKFLRESVERKKGFGICFHMVSCPSLREPMVAVTQNSDGWICLRTVGGQITKPLPLFLILFVGSMSTVSSILYVV